jgi:Lrp/AsnC family leucine-responsive transcriptional regulator
MKDIDRKILLQLLKDSKQPVIEIARKLGVTRQTVAKKIDGFKKDGTIEAFTARLDPKKFGLTIKAYILLREEPDVELRRKNEKIIRQFTQATEFYRIFGRYSAVLELLVRDEKELSRIVKRIHRLKGIRETETLIVHSTIKNVPESPFVRLLSSTRKFT